MMLRTSFLNTPKKTIAFACVVLVLVVSIFWFGGRIQDSFGLPAIQVSVDKQLNNLIRQSPELNGLSIGSKTRRYIVGSAASARGYFIYDAQQSGSDIELRVDWKKDATNCLITKVESLSSYAEPKILWKQP